MTLADGDNGFVTSDERYSRKAVSLLTYSVHWSEHDWLGRGDAGVVLERLHLEIPCHSQS